MFRKIIAPLTLAVAALSIAAAVVGIDEEGECSLDDGGSCEAQKNGSRRRQPKCEDKEEECGTWAKAGECTNNPNYSECHRGAKIPFIITPSLTRRPMPTSTLSVGQLPYIMRQLPRALGSSRGNSRLTRSRLQLRAIPEGRGRRQRKDDRCRA